MNLNITTEEIRKISSNKLRFMGVNVLEFESGTRIIEIANEYDSIIGYSVFSKSKGFILDNLPDDTDNKEALENYEYTILVKRPYGLVQLLVSTEDGLYKNNKGKVMGRHRSLILKQDGTVLIDEMNDSVEYRDNFIERFKYLNYTNNATTKLITSIRDYGVDTEYNKLKRDIVKDGWVRNLWPHFTIMEDDKYQVVNNHHSNIRIDNAGFIVRNTIKDTKKHITNSIR